MNVVYLGEYAGVSVAVDGSTWTFEKGTPKEVPASVARKLTEENPTIWRAEQADKPKKADKAAPESKETK